MEALDSRTRAASTQSTTRGDGVTMQIYASGRMVGTIVEFPDGTVLADGKMYPDASEASRAVGAASPDEKKRREKRGPKRSRQSSGFLG